MGGCVLETSSVDSHTGLHRPQAANPTRWERYTTSRDVALGLGDWPGHSFSRLCPLQGYAVGFSCVILSKERTILKTETVQNSEHLEI